MAGVSGASRHSNVNLQPTAGVETVDEPKQAEAATSVEIVDEASTATRTERARSMDMGNLNLADQLAAKLGELDEGGPSLIDEDALGIVDFANDMSGVVDSAKLEEMISWGAELLSIANLSPKVYKELKAAVKDMREIKTAQDRGGD